jgi:hypothetical protein
MLNLSDGAGSVSMREISRREMLVGNFVATPIARVILALGGTMSNARDARQGEGERRFSEADYVKDTKGVVAHAAATGRAVVQNADGRPRVIISIPTSDLPTLDD